MLWLLTIKHTGTHYTFQQLKNIGLRKGHFDVKNGVINDDPDYVHLHVDEPHGAMKYPMGHLILTTLRNPIAVFNSYGRRYDQSVKTISERVVKSFADWEAMVEKYNPYIFTVDQQDREMATRNLANWLGRTDIEYIDVDPATAKAQTINHRCDFDFREKAPNTIAELAIKYGYEPN